MKKISAIIASIGLTAASTGVAFAANPPVSVSTKLCPPAFSNLCGVNIASSNGLVGGIIQVLFIIAILAALFFLIYGGIRWITSGGDKGKVDQARSTIVAALVGLIIAFLAFAITNFVLIFFTGQGTSQLTLPKLI